jgi:chromosome segregation ATPase
LLILSAVACAPNVKQLTELNGYKSQAENIISTAKEKIKIAKEKGAEKYSPDNLNSAIASLQEAEKYYAVGVLNHKKSYKIAKENYLNAIKYGNTAIKYADLAIEISETLIVIGDAEKAIEEAKKSEAGIYSSQKISNAVASLNQAQQSLKAGNYSESRDFAKIAIKSANDAKEEAGTKKGNLDTKIRRFEKAKDKLTESLKRNEISGIIEGVKEISSAEAELLKYRIEISEKEDEKISLKQSLSKIKETESSLLGLIEKYYRAKKERDDAEQKVKRAKEERDMLKEKIERLKVKVEALSNELNDLIGKRNNLIEK